MYLNLSRHYLIWCSVLLLFTCELKGQELSNIGKSPLLTVSGGFSANQTFFMSQGGTTSQRQPYAYTLTGNLNMSLYGWSIPLSVVYSNKQWTYSQPFNQYTLAPSYKWLKLYLGNTSMTFSPYTLSGHQFFGVGAELTPPGKLSGSIMAGRLQKRVLPDSLHNAETAYQRFGAGGKINYQLPFGALTAVIFYAKDDSSSLPFLADSTLHPQENLNLGLSGNATLLKTLSFSFDYACSILTENLYATASDEPHFSDLILRNRTSTHRYQALKTALSYNTHLGSIGLSYERVGNGYASLGAYYNNNDFQNYTLNYAGGIFDNKVNLAASYGVQKDNLSGNSDQGTTRTIENLSVTFTPDQRFNLSLNYNDYNTYTHIKSVFDDLNTTSPYANLDTLSYTQLSRSFSGNTSLLLGNREKVSHRLGLNCTFQQASQDQAGSVTYAGNKIFSSSFSYSLGTGKKGFTPTLTCNYNHNVSDTLVNRVVGPSVSVRKSFFDKKVNLGLMCSYNRSFRNHIWQSRNTILRITASYVVQKKHNLSFSSAMAFRKSVAAGSTKENTMTLTYSYSFSANSKTKSSQP